MREGGKILGKILAQLKEMIKPKVSSMSLEHEARRLIQKASAQPAFLNYDAGFMAKFPAALCISINDEIVHGIPKEDKVFNEGDVIGIDCGIWYKGMCVDSAITVPCKMVSAIAKKLINTTQEALEQGINACRVGNYLADISRSIQDHVEKNGFFIIKTLVGHGVGTHVHEDPQVPNFFPFDIKSPHQVGPRLDHGMTLAIEPMVSLSTHYTKEGKDGFASVTEDGSLAAHFEHTVAITKTGTIVLTQVYDNLGH